MVRLASEVTSKVLLYSVFHLNLAFSSIPKSHYALILDRCYWPLLEIARRMKVPFGLEATGFTLEILDGLDASFIKALRAAWAQDEIEFVGSSYTQSIFPLCPARANAENIRIGNQIYQELLGKTPQTAYVNEQTYASGLVDLYLDAGYSTLFMEWNNPARFHAYASEARYRPQRALNPEGKRSISVVWNDSIAFQKLQRVLSAQLSSDEYLDFLRKQIGPDSSARGIPFYGSDAEIIDYHPGDLEAAYLASRESKDIQTLVALIERINEEPVFQWIRVGDFAAHYSNPADPPIRLESPEYPLPCKKQPAYNPTRWAVSGRENIHLNTQCFRRFHEMMVLESLRPEAVDTAMWRHLLESWGSDFRTHTTEEKMTLLRQTMAALTLSLEERLIHPVNNPLHVVLWNPNDKVYDGPMVLEVQFPHGVMHGYPQLASTSLVSAFQMEELGYYQDGTVRWLKGIFMVHLPPRSEAVLVWESADKPLNPVSYQEVRETSQSWALETDSVSLTLLPRMGGAVAALQFRQLDSRPWVGTISHGYFDNIELAMDHYSGHFFLGSKSGQRATDLHDAVIQLPENLQDYPIRIPVGIGLTTELGKVWKTIYVYRHLPRVDLMYHFRFQDIAAATCQVGMMTVLPEAFSQEQLRYCTVNGGYVPERFYLKGHRVTHADPVSINVSAQHGLGATEGWVAIEDDQKRLILRTYPQWAYAMPMIQYEDSAPSYFLRVLPSIGEFDDTAHLMWRGHHQLMFSWIGQKDTDSVDLPRLPLSLSANASVQPV